VEKPCVIFLESKKGKIRETKPDELVKKILTSSSKLD
jgi:hypothetical protein